MNVKGLYIKGFTAMEFLVVIAILVILTAVTLRAFSNNRRESNLQLASQEVISALFEARNRTLASDNADVYGVHFETETFTLFKGNLYDPADPENKKHTFPAFVEMGAIMLDTSEVDVIFKRLTGETDGHGTITLWLTTDNTKTRIIKIEPTGLLYRQ